MAHTKGPWKVDIPFPNEVYIEGPNRGVVAFVAHNHDKRNEQMDDAHLIAAAPDLLAACEAFVEAWEKCLQLEKTDIALQMAQIAIERARGK